MREKIFKVSYCKIMSLLIVAYLKMTERPQETCGHSLCPVPGGLFSFELKLVCTGRALLFRKHLSAKNIDKSINYYLHTLLSTYFLIRESVFHRKLILTALSANS